VKDLSERSRGRPWHRLHAAAGRRGRLPRCDAVEWPPAALLHDVGEFVGEQAATGLGAGLVLTGGASG
jgi:predicted HD phosphohydrolase